MVGFSSLSNALVEPRDDGRQKMSAAKARLYNRISHNLQPVVGPRTLLGFELKACRKLERLSIIGLLIVAKIRHCNMQEEKTKSCQCSPLLKCFGEQLSLPLGKCKIPPNLILSLHVEVSSNS
jgi:hypothetical protein